MVTADLRELSRTRLRETRALLAAQEWSGAYYLAGYAVECGLKACIAAQFSRHHMPDLKVVKESYTHDLDALVKQAQLDGQLRAAERTDSIFALNWAVTKDWNETSRYRIWSQGEAEDIYKAITQRGHGVFRWVKQYW